MDVGEGLSIWLLDAAGEQVVGLGVGTMCLDDDTLGLVLNLPGAYYRDEDGRHVLLKRTGSDLLSYPHFDLKKEVKSE